MGRGVVLVPPSGICVTGGGDRLWLVCTVGQGTGKKLACTESLGTAGSLGGPPPHPKRTNTGTTWGCNKAIHNTHQESRQMPAAPEAAGNLSHFILLKSLQSSDFLWPHCGGHVPGSRSKRAGARPDRRTRLRCSKLNPRGPGSEKDTAGSLFTAGAR